MGYRVHVLSPDKDSPAGHLADVEVTTPYEDLDAVRAFARQVQVVTFEFENVPATTVEALAEIVPVRPGGWVLHTTQNRAREKGFLAAAGLPVTPFAPVSTSDELAAAVAKIGCPAILKTASFGYDGKGQARVMAPEEAGAAWAALNHHEAILERFVPFEMELSVVAARGSDGSFAHYGAIENQHRHHILDVSIAPARVPEATARHAVEIAHTVLEQLEVVGVLCVEFFLTGKGELLINELAPRPHNSGHLTFGAALTSQFEQQIRAVCGLPLGASDLFRPAAMANLLGDLWEEGTPNWPALAAAFPDVKLHLYGKQAARAGRKMGHLLATAATPDEALARVVAAREALTIPSPTST